MKLLITGGAGFIGSNLIRFLIQHTDHTILNCDALTYAGNQESLTNLESNPRYEFSQTDLLDAIKIQTIIADYKPNWILHLAAESHVDRSIDAPETCIQTNVIGTFNLLEAARSHYHSLNGTDQKRFRFLHVSTDEVYGSLGEEGLFSETTSYDPHSPYSASKAAADHLVRAWYHTYQLPVLLTNCSNNYGPYQFPEKLIPVVIVKALQGELIPVYGKGENIRDWLYVEDHCRALHTVISKGRIGETYNIGGNNEQRNIDLVETLSKLLDELKPRVDGKSYTEQISFVTDRPGHDLRYAIDASKIQKELGWKPQQDHQSGLRKTVQWYLENIAWAKQYSAPNPAP